ncbi:phosphoadenylyl-sulfate reductase [Pseudohoeflea coraliihabitans]|uniref:Adenosine 5'-phosphosulfate reductase n=1 Tax=Pseudohoeflea coraliihabitans TaxID=2860393 RepID=A0ABS6WS34_9HYPH|nr:phosphoadenylyl-sulfate reductase [Pseudohoeflea sp. DP4N28-3]MBW3098600.1 phosphoadenylyl-sulfate reductase [Pseudohoeflea sp. DP4N28-3]
MPLASSIAQNAPSLTPTAQSDAASPQAGQAEAARLAATLAALPLEARLVQAGALGRAVFTTSLGLEDQVLTAAIARSGAEIDIVTLQTGRLFDETLMLIGETQSRYGVEITQVEPQVDEVSGYVAEYGLNGFYDSVAARHACCDIRKMRPLARVLSGADVWVTGIRRGQSHNRAQTPLAEYDPVRELIKINPLADVPLERLERMVTEETIPVNPLHRRGYPSIGCAPCTRAIKPGEPERAGRWWWENDEKRECGLHVGPAATPTRTEKA